MELCITHKTMVRDPKKSYIPTSSKFQVLWELANRLHGEYIDFDRQLKGLENHYHGISSKITEVTGVTGATGATGGTGIIDPTPSYPVQMGIFLEDNTINTNIGGYVLVIQLTKLGGEIEIATDTTSIITPSPPFSSPTMFPSAGGQIGAGHVVIATSVSLTFSGTQNGTGPYIGHVTASANGTSITRQFTYYLPIF